MVRLAVLIALAVAAPTAAFANDNQFVVSQIDSITPKCRDFPDAPVVGRVSGFIGVHPTRGVSFVGCFGSIGACEAWRGPVSGRIDGRLILDRCTFRY